MRWLKLELQTPATELEAIEEYLQEIGAISISEKSLSAEPSFEFAPGEIGEWSQLVISALFPESHEPQAIREILNNKLTSEMTQSLRFEWLADRDWTRVWMEDFKPMRYGKNLWVVPSFATPPEPDATNLILDPGGAFGSGTHETTRLCLQWLANRRWEGERLLDFGCGSGILAMAGLLLGAPQAWACDIDPRALEASRENSETNHLSQRLWLGAPEELQRSSQTIPKHFELLVANILAPVLEEIAPNLAALQQPGDEILLSGLLRSQEADIVSIYEPWYALNEQGAEGDWVLLQGTRLGESCS